MRKALKWITALAMGLMSFVLYELSYKGNGLAFHVVSTVNLPSFLLDGYFGSLDTWFEYHYGNRLYGSLIHDPVPFIILTALLWFIVGYELGVSIFSSPPLRLPLRLVKNAGFLGSGLFLGYALLPSPNAPPWYHDIRMIHVGFIVWSLAFVTYGAWDTIRSVYRGQTGRRDSGGPGV